MPRADCGPGSLPETSTQGRVPRADYKSGRADRGYFCNTRQVSHQGASGGFKTLRYTDKNGNTCAYYDSTLLVGRDIVSNLLSGDGLGVVVLDMNDPANPRKTANLPSLAMLTPHESLLVNKKRGLLVAEMGTAATLPGVLAIYDVKTDCRKPKLSTTLASLFGHESGFSPDGKTFYTSGRRPASRRSTCRTRASRGRSTKSSTCSTTACGSPTTARRSTPPTSARSPVPG